MELVEQLRTALAGEPAVVTAWLFGSQARGTARTSSDVDVAVIADLDFWEQLQLGGRLESIVRKRVDVVDFARGPADLTHRVLRDGILLLDRDRARRVATEVKKQNEYFDMTPTWQRIRKLPKGMAP